MVKEAADRAPSGQRVKIRYDWLLHDLQLLRKGVADHVDAPRQPRPVPPLRGDYRQ
jgi:RAQPRD family integrative conjugative element protein